MTTSLLEKGLIRVMLTPYPAFFGYRQPLKLYGLVSTKNYWFRLKD
jgi:hypothetical protein